MAFTYSATAFHRPRRKRTTLTIASSENAAVSAMNTPVGPNFAGTARKYANGISNTHSTPRLIQVGVHVSPAPLNDCVTVIAYAYSGNPSAMIRRLVAPTSSETGSFVKRFTNGCANSANTSPTKLSTAQS